MNEKGQSVTEMSVFYQLHLFFNFKIFLFHDKYIYKQFLNSKQNLIISRDKKKKRKENVFASKCLAQM